MNQTRLELLQIWAKTYPKFRAEEKRLIALNHSRIQPFINGLFIDSWCDGNETEVIEIDRLTRNYKRLFNLVYETCEKLDQILKKQTLDSLSSEQRRVLNV